MRRTLAPWVALIVVLVVAGGVIYAAADGVLEAIGVGCMGLAAVLAVSCAFYAVGISEDRERERARPGGSGRA